MQELHLLHLQELHIAGSEMLGQMRIYQTVQIHKKKKKSKYRWIGSNFRNLSSNVMGLTQSQNQGNLIVSSLKFLDLK